MCTLSFIANTLSFRKQWMCSQQWQCSMQRAGQRTHQEWRRCCRFDKSPKSLERLMVAGPDIARVLLEFVASCSTPSDTTTGKQHHEQSHCTQFTFAKDVPSLSVGNSLCHVKPIPWRQWRHTDSRHKGHQEQICDKNCKHSWRDRSTSVLWICGGQAESAWNKPLRDIVSKNNVALFSTHPPKQR